ncbi:26171_t:CDS:10 [Dentiscutata erythropus]|uniref:Glutamate--cysteine ligase n=1 Tax=Dentiscutata erythropus TaxID=1348616 RepID=A0A9N9FB95_9GLOM|nr:26171_t:CDS:10 [Dentiscutata erythropus]
MGLSQSKHLPWEQAKQYADHIRNHGITQFLSIYNKTKNRDKDCLIEYMIIVYDDEGKNAKLSLRGADILHELQKEEEALGKDEVVEASWQPEYAANTLKSLLRVEQNMKLRRKIVSKHLGPNERITTLSNYPRLGCPGQFLEPHHEPFGPRLKSSVITDNIRDRRGSDITINIPIFHDRKDSNLFLDREGALPDHIFMDAAVFGPGSCSLQTTIQACNIGEARKLYDQLAIFGPIMLALTAATPIWRGYLSDMDCRWFALVESTDDRTKEERGLEPLKNDRFVINKPRFDSISYYISTDKTTLKEEYNDLNSVYDQNIYKRLIDNGVDELLARHVSYLFIRDPLFVSEDSLDQDDESPSDHFEVDENKVIAYKRDALNTEKFWFRKNIFANNDGDEDEFEQMTINEIINGNGKDFPGLIDIMLHYLESMNIDIETRYHLEKYLEFISMRASGKIQTAATWIRNFVRSHPNYNHDSVVSQEINYDLIKMMEEIQKGQVKVPELLSEFNVQ